MRSETGQHPVLMKTLRNGYSTFTAAGVSLKQTAPQHGTVKTCGEREGRMYIFEFHPEALMLIPAAAAVIFMLWVLWSLNREIRKERRRH
jgi:hypothetical protein